MQHLVAVYGAPFLACVLMSLVLGYLGIHVLKREVIFVDVAMAQTVAVGAIAAHIAFGWHAEDLRAQAAAFGVAALAAVCFAGVRRRVTEIPLEAVIGVSYAVAAAAALFLVGVAPGGHIHVQHMLSGSILWAGWRDLGVSAIAFSAVGVALYLMRRPLDRASNRYHAASPEGLGSFAWDFVFYAILGVVITLAVRVAGVVLVFALLIMPATISALMTDRLSARLVATWVSAAAASLLGLLFADRLDFSVGPSIAACLGAFLAVAAACRRIGPAGMTAALGVVFLTASGVLLAMPSTARALKPHITEDLGQPAPAHGRDHTPHAAHDSDETATQDIGQVREVQSLVPLYHQATDASLRARIVLRAIELDRKAGADLALEYLKQDPPLFFRQSVIDELIEAAGKPLPFQTDQPFTAPANQEAVRQLRQALED